MDNLIRDVVILGGGTAGWMTASYLSKVMHGTVRITLIEADTIPKIGVGEATVPNLQRIFWDTLGIAEDEWMKNCNAAFKTAIKFVNWRGGSKTGIPDHFYHVFGLLPSVDDIPLSQYWVEKREQGFTERMDYACFPQPQLMDKNLSPRFLNGTRAVRYAWHFDAHHVAKYLQTLAVGWGVRHVVDELDSVQLDAQGNIASLRTKRGGVYEGDLFIDCSGFKALLINKAMGEPFLDMSDHLLCDSAVAAAIPANDEVDGIEPFTSAIALNHGWCWKIPMLGRFGAGYVHSSKFVTMDQAAEEYLKHWRVDESKVALNKIRFRVGRNRRAWVKNCVSIGLASCFLEPLESTGIYFICASLYQLAEHFPDRSFDHRLSDSFNSEIEGMFDDCRDFIQAHYLTTPREDTAFWRANRHDLHLSDNVKHKLELYNAGLPINALADDEEAGYYSSFDTEFRNYWTNSSYYCILAGMGCVPKRSLPIVRHKASMARAEEKFRAVKERAQLLESTLPTTYEYLKLLHGEGHPSMRKSPNGGGRVRVFTSV